jgi:carboxymethylenebutenolidase
VSFQAPASPAGVVVSARRRGAGGFAQEKEMTATRNSRTPTITHHRLPVEGGELPLAIARAGGAGAAVVIMPSAFGIASDLEVQMEELATDASIVVAIDPFFRDDAGPAPYEDMARVMARLQGLDHQRGYRDLRAAIAWARAQEAGQPVVILGICFGGPYALLAAADGVIDGVVTWHGTRMENYVERAAEMRCPMRLHFGGADPFVPPKAVEAVRAAFAGHGDVRIIVHDGATHGFSHRAAPQAYDEHAERAGMDSLRELIVEAGRQSDASTYS